MHSQLYLKVRRYGSSVSPEKLIRIHAATLSPDVEREIKLSEDTLEGFVRVSHGYGADFALFLIPAQRQVSPTMWAALLKKSNLPADCCTPEEPNVRLAAFARGRGIPVLDLLPVLRSQGGDKLYSNEHFTLRGHVVVAEAIAEFLMQNGLLGTPGTHLVMGE